MLLIFSVIISQINFFNDLKSIIPFLKTTIYGGVLFLVPITIIFYILNDFYKSLYKMVSPIVVSIGVEKIGGKIAVIFIVIFLLMLICFLAGLIVKLGVGKRMNEYIDGLALKFIPGYDKLKAETVKTVDKKVIGKVVNIYDDWQAVFMKYNIEWKIAFIIEESDEGLLTIFEPGSPEFLKGTTKLIAKEDLITIPIETEKAISYLKKYGSVVSELLRQRDIGLNNQGDSKNIIESKKERFSERERDRVSN